MNKTNKSEMYPDSLVDQASVRAEVTHFLYTGSTLSLATGGVLAVLLVLTLWGGAIPSSVLLGWLIMVDLVYVSRILLTAAYRRSAPVDKLPWLKWLRISVGLSGAVWGSAGFLLFPYGDPVHQSVLAFAFAGLAAGAVATYAIDLAALFGFLLPATLPLLISLFAEGTSVSTLMGAMVLLFLGFVFMSGRISHNTVYQNIRLRIAASQREDALHVANERLTGLIKALPDAIVFKDGDGRWLVANETANTLFCLNEFDWQGKSEIELASACPEDCNAYEVCQTGDEKTWNAGEMTVDNERIYGKDGQPRDFEIRKIALFDGDSRRKGLVLIARDITERHHAERREHSRNRVLELLANGAPLTQILYHIISSVEQENPEMICSILLLDEKGKHLLMAAAPSLPDFYNEAIHGMEIGIGMGSCGTAAITGERVIVDNIQTHPYWVAFKEVAARASLGSCWSEPIKSQAGKVRGTFAIYNHDVHIPSRHDIQLIEQSAKLAEIAIERSRANEKLQLASMFYQNCSEAMMVTDSDGTIITVNPAFTLLTGYTSEEVIGKDPKILGSDRHDQSFFQAMWHSLNTSGQWKGEIWNRRKNGEIFAEWLAINTIYDEDGLVHRRVALFSDITKKKEDEELIWQQANYDSLTNLPNRRMFYDRLNQEIRKTNRAGLPLAVMFIDLDRFKEVNDILGHDVGDLLLKDAAQRVIGCVRETDTVARLGGDEFTIILGALDDPSSVDRVAQKILRKLSDPFKLGEEAVYLSASIGITMYPEDATDIDTLLKHADQAMYSAKRQGRNRCNYFTKSMQEAAQFRMQIAKDLRNALADQQFRVVYQPIVELASGAIRKAEALIRWEHPTRGLISPDEFIPVAEDTGLIIDIGDWIFREAARQAGLWRAAYFPTFQISVNKSPVQFQNENNGHVEWFEHLAELGLPGQSIVVEITEGLLLDTTGHIIKQLLEFRDAGMQVSLDDFGTGYSSLSYLKKFDIDYIKIDRSFVKNLAENSDDMALCEAIIVMAHKLGIKVIAEGIETKQQRDLLAAAGCDYGQGYLFLKPVPSEEFEALLKSKRAA